MQTIKEVIESLAQDDEPINPEDVGKPCPYLHSSTLSF